MEHNISFHSDHKLVCFISPVVMKGYVMWTDPKQGLMSGSSEHADLSPALINANSVRLV